LAFDDCEKLLSLGLEAIINTPVVVAGHTLGTFNVLHRAGWYRRGDDAVTKFSPTCSHGTRGV
jgi:hypothetical protein